MRRAVIVTLALYSSKRNRFAWLLFSEAILFATAVWRHSAHVSHKRPNLYFLLCGQQHEAHKISLHAAAAVFVAVVTSEMTTAASHWWSHPLCSGGDNRPQIISECPRLVFR